jgi:hypothetical protein
MNTYTYTLDKKILFECVASNIQEADSKFFNETGLNLSDKKNWIIGCSIIFNKE